MKSFLTLLLITFVTLCQAQSGTPDKTYGTDKTGTVTNSSDFGIVSSAIQPDNKLLLGASGYGIGQFILARRNEDGSVDTSFGKGGEVSTDISSLIQNIIFVSGWKGVVVQPDGKIVAAGYVEYRNNDDIVLARFLPNGTPDETFGSGGLVITDLNLIEIANAVTLQEDGKIVVAGEQINNFNDAASTLVIRYNKDGTLDNSFGKGNGYVTYGGQTEALAILIQPDDKIVAGGSKLVTPGFFLVRYLTDGSLDKSFGNEGTVTTVFSGFGNGAQINSLALDSKLRIATAGVLNQFSNVEVVRYLPDGSLDNSFNKNGQLQLNFNDVSHDAVNVSTLLAQPDSKLVVSSALFTDYANSVVTPVLSGLNEDGSPDVSFGTDKGQTIVATSLVNDGTEPAVMQNDGKIIVASGNYNYTTKDNTYLLSRFIGYPVHVSLAVRIKRFIHNHSITWNGLPADDHIDYYSVEQSSSNRTGFLPIAKLSGRSNLRDYSVSNSNLLQGTNYYRIKAVSTDGVVRYSEVVSADNITNTASVFPNPVKSYVTVQGLQSNATSNIIIKDGSGTILTRGTSSGSTQYRLSVGNLLPGTYYLNITTAGKTETLPFVKE